jgi:hypothetical protein
MFNFIAYLLFFASYIQHLTVEKGTHRKSVKNRQEMASEKLPLDLIGVYQDAFNR